MTDKTDSKERDLMDLVDAYAEARHIGGCHTYNAKTAEARNAVIAKLALSGFDAADMATASAQGFREGVASIAASAGSEPVALPQSWVPLSITHEGQHPEEVAYGPQIMMERLGKWLRKHFDNVAWKPLNIDEARDLTCMLAGAPWPDEMLPELQQLLGIYDGLRAHGQRPVDPATLPRKVAKAVMKTGLLPATPQQPAPSAAQPAAEPVTSGVADGAVWVRYDLTDGLKEQAIKDQLIALGWTPPPAGAKPSPTPQADSTQVAAPADTVVLDAALRAIHQAIDLIGEPDTERLRTVRRVLRGAVVVAEDGTAPQADSQPATVVDMGLPESVYDAVAAALGDAYDCIRTWSAWSYGTMRSDDFLLVAEDDERVTEIAHAAIDAYRAARAPADSVTAPAYSIDADPQGIRARVADAISGALAFGAQGANPPPTGHWLVPFWETAREEARRNRPVSSDTLYLLRRLLSNQHTLTSAEFREELTKIVGEAAQAADSALKDHQIAALVNELRDIAIQYHSTQQLRERIAQTVVPALKARAADSVLEDASRWNLLPAFIEKYQIDYVALLRDIDAARKQGANHD